MAVPRTLGETGEIAAVEFLRKAGYRILARNYKTPLGEIDIVAQDGETLVFIEVKARSTSSFGSPGEAVDRKKQGKIGRVALYYLSEKRIKPSSCRFDVVVIFNGIHLVKNAFDVPE
jgi:putative endonuclease